MRKSFWEHANELSDFGAEARRIQKLLFQNEWGFAYLVHTLAEYINTCCFQDWAKKHGLTYISIEDGIDSLGLSDIVKRIQTSTDHADVLKKFLLYIEFIYNVVKTVSSRELDGIPSQILRNIEIDCNKLNLEIKADNENRYIIVEKNAAATAVADQYISIDKDFSFKVIEYNHFLLRGNLARKKEILLALGEKFEPLRPKLKSGSYSQVESDAGFLLNNLNLRHNNVTPGSPGKYHAFVVGMSAQDMEEWYDKTYDALLFALQADNYIDLSKNVSTLKKQIDAADKTTP